MMRYKITAFLLSLFLAACSAQGTPTIEPTIPATDTSQPSPTLETKVTATPAPPFFEIYSPDPIVPRGEKGTWDDRYTDPGAVIYHDGLFHMFRNGFRAFPATSQVGYVTSSDGYIWEKQGEEPIFKSDDVPLNKIGMYASSVIVEDDGTWVMYFYTWDSPGYPQSRGVIGRASAASPNGPWTSDETPVLVNGPSGAWDSAQVLAPFVLKTEAGYIMYFSGADEKGIQRIGMATSEDGIRWTKYNDPATTDKPFAQSDPVFVTAEGNEWDSGWVHQPRVFETDKGWLMIYRGARSSSGQGMAIGMATSDDGIHWGRSPLNPVFHHRQIPRAAYLWFHSALIVDDTIFLFIEGDISQSTQIYLATHQLR